MEQKSQSNMAALFEAAARSKTQKKRAEADTTPAERLAQLPESLRDQVAQKMLAAGQITESDIEAAGHASKAEKTRDFAAQLRARAAEPDAPAD